MKQIINLYKNRQRMLKPKNIKFAFILYLAIHCAALFASFNHLNTRLLKSSPDLIPIQNPMAVFRILPDPVPSGATVSGTNFLLRNNSNIQCTGFKIGVYISTDDNITINDILLKSIEFESFEAGIYQMIEPGEMIIPETVNVGEYYVGVLIDYENTVAEADEENNILLSNYKLDIIGPIDADLVFSYYPALGIDDPQPLIGVGCSVLDLDMQEGGAFSIAPQGRLTFFFLIENDGPEELVPFRIGYFISDDANVTNDDYMIGFTTIQEIEGNSPPMAVYEKFILPESIIPGDYSVGAILDYQNQILEIHGTGPEENNVVTRHLVVKNVISDNTSIWRARIRLKTADVENARTIDDFDNPILIELGCTGTYLDYARDDFQKGSNDWYDLLIGDNFKYRDLHALSINKYGGNGWCLSEFELELNDEIVLSHIYPNNIWLNHGSRVYFSYEELRSNPEWSNAKEDWEILLSFMTVEKEQLSSLIQCIVGDESQRNEEFYWKKGKSVSLIRVNDTTIKVTLPLEASVSGWFDPDVDVTFNLKFTCDCDGIKIIPDDFDYSMSWFYEQIASAINFQLPTSGIDPQTIDLGLPFCPVIEVTDEADVKFDIFTHKSNGSIDIKLPQFSRSGGLINLSYNVANIGNLRTDSYFVYSHLEDAAGNIILDLPNSTPHIELDPCGTKQASWSQQITLPEDLECNIKYKKVLKERMFGLLKPKLSHFQLQRFPPDYYIVSNLDWSSDVDETNNFVKRRLNIGAPDIAIEADLKQSSGLSGGRIKLVYNISNLGTYNSGKLKVGMSLVNRISGVENENVRWIAEIDNIKGGEYIEGEITFDQDEITELRSLERFKLVVESSEEINECNYENNEIVIDLDN